MNDEYEGFDQSEEDFSDEDMYHLVNVEYGKSLEAIHKDKKVKEFKDMLFMEIACFGGMDPDTLAALVARISEIVSNTRRAN
jgi:hypothetical protein